VKKQPQRVRSRLNQVTGRIEHTVLDRVQLAVEYVQAAIDRQGKNLGNAEYARLLDRVYELVGGMRRSGP